MKKSSFTIYVGQGMLGGMFPAPTQQEVATEAARRAKEEIQHVDGYYDRPGKGRRRIKITVTAEPAGRPRKRYPQVL